MPDTVSPLDLAHTALLVMDYQAGIVGSLPGADALVARMAETLALARDRGLAIAYVRVAFEDEDIAAIPATHRFSALLAQRGDAMRADSPATAIVEPLAPQSGDIVVRKVRVGPFSTTDLREQLEAKGVTTLVLAGVSTSGVVLSTIRAAVDADFRVLVLADLVADRDPEVHRVLIEKVFPGQGDVVTAAEFTALLSA